METTAKCKLCGKKFDQTEYSYIIHRQKGYCTQRCYEYDFIRQLIESGIREEGFKHERVNHTHGDFEKAFFEAWKKDNEVHPGINYGNGTLQDLFMEQNSNPLYHAECMLYIEPRDRFIVATVIQWLGTNCGMGFLHQVFNSIGKVLIDKKEGTQYITPKPNLTITQINEKIEELVDEAGQEDTSRQVAWAVAKWILTY